MTAKTHAQRATQYARDVVAGRILACLYVRQACQRHLDDLKKQRTKAFKYRFDEDRANRLCRFVELLPHTKGKWAANRERIRLEDWQCFAIGVPFGWLKKGTKLRRFRRAYTEVPRKNAKSTLTAGIGLYMFAADGEHGAEVYSGAATEKQAWEVFRPARLMAQQTPALLAKYGIHVGAKTLSIAGNGSRFEPIIGKPGDGASPSFPITDEYHEHPDETQYDTMLTGMGAREQPMSWVITTAGTTIEGPCYALRTEVAEMLSGRSPNDELWGLIYSIDKGDDWTSEESLRKANPNFGVSVNPEILMAAQRTAIANPRKAATFKTKHLCMWVTAASPYLNAELWDRAADPFLKESDFAGEACWMGVDLASKVDLVSAAKVFRRDQFGVCAECHGDGSVLTDEHELGECPRCSGSGKSVSPHYYAFSRNYLPKARAEDPEAKHYAEFVAKGALIATPGNVTDFETVEADLQEDASRYHIAALGFDPWNAAQMAGRLAAHGVTCVECPQNVQRLSQPMKELQALITDGRIHHTGDPVLSWAIGNVTAQEDRNDNVFPRKERPQNKIDPAVALIIAMGGAMLGESEESIYEKRAPVVLSR